MRLALRILAWVLIVLGLAPMMIAVIAAEIASRHGCTLHEGFPAPCIIGGKDWGPTLLSMGILGWLGIVTSPLLLAGLIVHLGLWLFRRRTPRP